VPHQDDREQEKENAERATNQPPDEDLFENENLEIDDDQAQQHILATEETYVKRILHLLLVSMITFTLRFRLI
jgi:hypothetical protein